MSRPVPSAERFSFVRRPVPVPGDLRIVWRLSLLLMILGTSRSKKASLVKLHVLNDAVRSHAVVAREKNTPEDGTPAPSWRVRVEPALGRAIDFLVGKKLAAWVEVSNRTGLQLTAAGIKSAEALLKNDTAMKEERALLGAVAKDVTESFVTALLGPKKEL
jgi:hypothetical protein